MRILISHDNHTLRYCIGAGHLLANIEREDDVSLCVQDSNKTQTFVANLELSLACLVGYYWLLYQLETSGFHVSHKELF